MKGFTYNPYREEISLRKEWCNHLLELWKWVGELEGVLAEKMRSRIKVYEDELYFFFITGFFFFFLFAFFFTFFFL